MVTKSTWEKSAPWFLTILSVVSIGLLSYFVIDNINWLKEYVNKHNAINDSRFFIDVLDRFTSMIKRTIGMFTALCLIFSGMGISAYVMSRQAKVEIKDSNWSFSLITASPGIVAMILGVVLMIVDIQSKDTFSSNDVIYQQKANEGLETNYK